jgi:hypothetical protein
MKASTLKVINEINADKRSQPYIPMEEEPLPKGFFSSKDIARKYATHHRRVQYLISELMFQKRLFVQFVRRKTNGLFVKRIPVYKFKNKTDEKSFKSRLKGK